MEKSTSNISPPSNPMVRVGTPLGESTDNQGFTNNKSPTMVKFAEEAKSTDGSTGSWDTVCEDDYEVKQPSENGTAGSGQFNAKKRRARSASDSASAKKPRSAPARIPAKERAAPRKAAPRKSAQDRKWEAPFVYTDSKSPLTNADIRVCSHQFSGLHAC